MEFMHFVGPEIATKKYFANRASNNRAVCQTFSVRHAVEEAPRRVLGLATLHERHVVARLYGDYSEQLHLVLLQRVLAGGVVSRERDWLDLVVLAERIAVPSVVARLAEYSSATVPIFEQTLLAFVFASFLAAIVAWARNCRRKVSNHVT